MNDIDAIEENHPKNSCICWNEALGRWIKQNYNVQKFGLPSWRTLLKAVALADKLLAKELASKYQGEFTQVAVCEA